MIKKFLIASTATVAIIFVVIPTIRQVMLDINDKYSKSKTGSAYNFVNIQTGSEKINLKNLELTVPLLLHSVRLWADIHEEDINTFSMEKLEDVTNTREFYGIHMLTVFEYCKIETKAKTAVICIDKDYLK